MQVKSAYRKARRLNLLRIFWTGLPANLLRRRSIRAKHLNPSRLVYCNVHCGVLKLIHDTWRRIRCARRSNGLHQFDLRSHRCVYCGARWQEVPSQSSSVMTVHGWHRWLTSMRAYRRRIACALRPRGHLFDMRNHHCVRCGAAHDEMPHGEAVR
jgi:hypothetical protein